MQIIELIARRHQMERLSLTVFKKNVQAMNFYTKKLKFQIDEGSPSQCGDQTASYEILSKMCNQLVSLQ